MIGSSLRGRLLVATPTLLDPNFHRSVLLMLEHGDEGALGVIINRPSESVLAGPLPDWDEFAAEPAVLFLGGPVAPANVVGLARVWPEPDGEGLTPILGRVAVVDLNLSPNALGAMVEEVRAFAGCAGWAAGQLEAEIGVGAWFVVDAVPDDVLSPRPEDLWSSVLRRQGGRLAMFATFPLEVSVN